MTVKEARDKLKKIRELKDICNLEMTADEAVTESVKLTGAQAETLWQLLSDLETYLNEMKVIK